VQIRKVHLTKGITPVSLVQTVWPYIDTFLRITPGIILLPLTFFLGWKKIGNKIHVSFSFTYERISASRLTNIVITNQKDKPATVHEIYALIDRHFVLPVQKLSPPVVIKGLETLALNTDPVSRYYLGEEEYDFDPQPGQILEIYLTTQDGLIKCKTTNTPSIQSYTKFKNYSIATTHNQRYNDIVYNENAAYALIYKYDGDTKTAIVESGGFILVGWPFLPNGLRQEDMASEKTVKAALMASEIKYIIKESELHVHKLS
jgi:hypothetical protein